MSDVRHHHHAWTARSASTAPPSSWSATSTELVVFISSFTTLLPGDVILTGTPEGVGPLQPGQEFSIDIEGIGTLTNPVTRA